MSADLFAEFAEDSSSKQQPKQPTRPGVQQLSSFSFFDGVSLTKASSGQSRSPQPHPLSQTSNHAPSQPAPIEDNDDWGDFEGGSSFGSPAPATQDPFAFAAPIASAAPQAPQYSWNTPATQDAFALSSNAQSQPVYDNWQQAPIIQAKKSTDPSVLFDAEDDQNDDDDFGDFEGVEETKTAPKTTSIVSSTLVDLMGDMSVTQSKPSVASTRESTSSDRTSNPVPRAKQGSVTGFGVISKPKLSSTVLTAAAPAVQKEDSWDTFDDWEASIPTIVQAKVTSKPNAMKSTPTASLVVAPAPLLSPTSDDPQSGDLPPTNVPPPGILLSLFLPLFTDAQEQLFKPMAAQTAQVRNRLLTEPATIAYLRGYLVLANVAAHIIAGRKLRWKRDQHLSQGMRIGPASSRATSGMKLTGIDKGESMKEEREVSDMVRVWKEQVGRLRHVVSGVNQIKTGTLGAVSDLNDVMPVQTLKQGEGGIPARQPCMLCGLKRDERVTTADMATGDSFGEWWIEQVNMHRGCRNFWNEHKDTLRQR